MRHRQVGQIHGFVHTYHLTACPEVPRRPVQGDPGPARPAPAYRGLVGTRGADHHPGRTDRVRIGAVDPGVSRAPVCSPVLAGVEQHREPAAQPGRPPVQLGHYTTEQGGGELRVGRAPSAQPAVDDVPGGGGKEQAVSSPYGAVSTQASSAHQGPGRPAAISTSSATGRRVSSWRRRAAARGR
ncbi:hypothetical protein [Streptomyces sp. NPDC088801]|uniref:hypothetical protein n=1 Tax=Streptomyces sp. NPDC088801 TaxID=3365903 RepID=UPI0037F780E6